MDKHCTVSEQMEHAILYGLLSGKIRIISLGEPGLRGVTIQNHTLPLDEEPRDNYTYAEYISRTVIGHVTDTVYRTLMGAFQTDKLQELLLSDTFRKESAMGRVLCMGRKRKLPNVLQNAMPQNIDLRKSTSIFARMWPIVPLLESIPCEWNVPITDEKTFCRENKDKLCGRVLHSTGDIRYAGFQTEVQSAYVYIQTVDMTKPWTLFSNPDAIESVGPIKTYKAENADIGFYKEIQKGESCG